MPCHIPLFPCYSLSLLQVISIHHCYAWHPEKHTYIPFSFPVLSSLTPSPGLFSCTHLPPEVEYCKMSCSPFWKDGYRELNFICSLLALSPCAPTPYSSGWLLFIHYLVPTTRLVLYKPENEGCLSSRKLLYGTNRWNGPSIVPIFSDEPYFVLPFFSNNLWEVLNVCI